MFSPLVLFRAPEVNPINKKAKSIPALNPINLYGRVFNFAWIGFFLAFLSWYAWAPLITDTIKKDLKLSQNEIANSNIIALTATLLVRAVAGPLCDKFGPRYVFAGTLLVGALPTMLAFTVKDATGLIVLRFFIGILGGSFVPCQVWTTGFFDRNIIGTANSFTGGFGNTGGGVTYFVMPAFYNHIMSMYHVRSHWAWRDAFFLPFALITTVAVLMLLLCPDTPTGKWSDRQTAVTSNLQAEHAVGHVVAHSGLGEAQHATHHHAPVEQSRNPSDIEKAEKASHSDAADIAHGEVVEVDAEYTHEIIQSPTPKEMLKVAMSPQTLVLMAAYFNSFGAELAVNAILGAYYLKNFPHLTQTSAGDWAAIFGTQNFIGRPLGGIISDVIYKQTGGSLWAKKIWMHVCGLLMGMFLIIIGGINSHHRPTMVGLMFCLGLFMDMGNGANFSLVPHVHPFANGIVSGLVGATGNFGGIIGAIIFRYNGTDYARSIWILGVICIAMHLCTVWVRPIPKGQIGGR